MSDAKNMNEFELATRIRAISNLPNEESSVLKDHYKKEYPSIWEKALSINAMDDTPTYEDLVGDFERNNDSLIFKNELYYPVQKVIRDKVKSRSFERIADTTTNVLKALESSDKGLVFGQVQSGKTTHFTYLIAKAFSTNYDSVIVLSGMNDDLRQQTQSRLELDLRGSNYNLDSHDDIEEYFENKKRIIFLTDEDDINKKRIPQNLDRDNKKFIAVIKKNNAAFRKIKEVLEKIGEDKKILIIDDEADSGTINTKPEKLLEKSAYNREINYLVDNFSAKYVAYTATPFANFLINEMAKPNLKADFIQYLGQPLNYQGYQQYFPVNGIKPKAKIVPFEGYGIRKASFFSDETFSDLIYLFMVDIIWNNRERATLGINITHYTPLHDEIKIAMLETLKKIKLLSMQRYNKKQSELHFRISVALEQLGYGNIPTGEENAFFKKMNSLVYDIIDNIHKANKDNVFDGEFSKPFNILIGGYKLGRGITIPDLTFYCLDRTSKEYDVILQQARFFGYRKTPPVLYISYENLEKFNSIVLPLDSLINQLIHASTDTSVERLFLDQVTKFRMTSSMKAGKYEVIDKINENYLGGNLAFTTGLISDSNRRNDIIIEFIDSAKEIKEQDGAKNQNDRPLRPYGKGRLFKTTSQNLIDLLTKLKGSEFGDDLIQHLEKMFYENGIETGFIFIPNGSTGIPSLISNINRRTGRVRDKGLRYHSTASIQKTDYLGDNNRDLGDFSFQRSTKDFLITFNQLPKNDDLNIDPIFIGLELGGGSKGKGKKTRVKTVPVNIGSIL